MRKLIYICLVSVILFTACDQGLAPLNTPESATSAFLTGTIHFIGGKDNWPPKDSVFAIRVVAFKNYPPGDIFTEVQSGNALLTFLSLPMFVDSADFSLEITKPPVEYKYIVAAMQTDSLSILAQKAVGVYTTTGDVNKPSAVSIEKGKTYKININVDFKNLPPQPF